MRQATLAAILVVAIFLAGAGMALAQSDPTAGFNAENVSKQFSSIGKLFLGVILFCFVLVGGYVIINSLVDAKKNGGWGHVVVGITMVLVAGLALWSLIGFAGEDPQNRLNDIKVQAK